MRKVHAVLFLTTMSLLSVVAPAFGQGTPPPGSVTKLGIDIDLRSGGRIVFDETTAGNVILPDSGAPPSTALPTVPQVQLRGGNLQVNNPAADGVIQIFPGFRPFVRATQSETSVAASGQNIVVSYNDSTGIHVSPNPNGPGLIVDRVNLSGYSVSHDGGQTWGSDFIPPASGATDTYGDTAVGVDRNGVFYFSNLGADASFNGTIQVNRSTDGGTTWSAAAIVQVDNGSDKPWLAVGPDPGVKNRDNVYVTWTSFQNDGSCQLRFGRSIDGGVTWAARTIYAPASDPDPTHPQNCSTFTNPVVDQITGFLYIPFLHFSNADQDFLQMMISDDAGATFRFATFNIPGAPNPTVMPVTQPGELTSCGANGTSPNLRLTIHGTANPGPGRFGLPRYVNASRMTLQPAAAARNGVVYMAWNNSTSPFFGDPAGKTNVLFIRSDDGGRTWISPIAVTALGTDKHQVLPSLAIDNDPNSVHISYYTQHADNSIDLDMVNSHDRGATFPTDRNVRVTNTPFDLPPTNIPLSNAPLFNSTNYDRQIAMCYALGEYQSVTTANGSVYVAWGDTRNKITEPVNPLNPISGQTHSQENVFFQKVKAQ